jgi:hydrogenase-4 component E
MNTPIDAIMVFLVLTNLLMLGGSRMATLIRMVTIQAIVLGLLPLVVNRENLNVHHYALAAGILILKGIFYPYLLRRAQRDANVRLEIEPFIGFSLSLLSGMLALAFSLWLGSRLPLPVANSSTLIVPVAFFTIICGLFLIVARRKALTQVIGYLTLENGIYAFGVGIAQDSPLLVEMGVLLDIFVAVFVMGIIIFHINREFDHIDTDRLATLRDWSSQPQNVPTTESAVSIEKGAAK